MNNKYLIASAFTILMMAFLFFSGRQENAKQAVQTETTEEDVIAIAKKNFPEATKAPVVNSADTSNANSSVSSTKSTGENQQVSERVLVQFNLHLKEMAKCLKLTTPQNLNEKTAPTTENLLAHLRSSLGDVVVQMDDWAQTEFIEKNSIKKRVRVDYEYPDGATPVRRLSMYQINSYGMPEIINLSADEINNPNEAYVASLSEGQDVTTVEKGARAYFSEGEELIVTTRNAQLQSLSINKADRSFNCYNINEETGNCNCQ